MLTDAACLAADDGTEATTSPNEGNEVTFEPETVTITASEENTEPVVVQIDGESFDFTPGETATVKVVEIDIKPGSDPNSIKLSANGAIPVAILSAHDFDATSIDPSTVELNSAVVRLRGNGYAASVEDVNQDGLMDLVVQVDRGGFLETGDDIGTLEGMTTDGLTIKGSDSVRVIK